MHFKFKKNIYCFTLFSYVSHEQTSKYKQVICPSLNYTRKSSNNTITQLKSINKCQKVNKNVVFICWNVYIIN